MEVYEGINNVITVFCHWEFYFKEVAHLKYATKSLISQSTLEMKKEKN